MKDIINLVARLIFFERLSSWNISILLIKNLSDTDIKNGKSINGNKKNQFKFTKVIYNFLSIVLSNFEKL